MRRPREQSAFRFSKEADPNYCASGFCRAKRRVAPTRTVTLRSATRVWVFRVCTKCALEWERVRGAKVERIQEVASA